MQVRDLLDARDLCALYSRAIDMIGITRGEVYNVGGGPENQRNLLEVIDQIGELAGKKPRFSHSDWREGDQKYYVSDVTKAKRDLGWNPDTDFDRGLRELISWAQSIDA
jgi:CDP-paratose 2-epimerase